MWNKAYDGDPGGFTARWLDLDRYTNLHNVCKVLCAKAYGAWPYPIAERWHKKEFHASISTQNWAPKGRA